MFQMFCMDICDSDGALSFPQIPIINSKLSKLLLFSYVLLQNHVIFAILVGSFGKTEIEISSSDFNDRIPV